MRQRAHASLPFQRKKFPNTRAITVARFVSLFLSRLASKVETFLLAEDTSFPPVANFEIACYNGQTEANNLLSETISRKWRLRATVTIPKYGKYGHSRGDRHANSLLRELLGFG